MAQVTLDRPIEMRPTNLQPCLEIGQRKARVLEVEHRLAERLAILGELDCEVERPLGRGLALDGDRQPLLRQLLHQHDKATVLRTHEAVGGQVHLVEKQF